MSDLNQALLDAMRLFLLNHGVEVHHVINFEETQKLEGYCETCYYEYVAVDITYENLDGDIKNYEYYSSFAQLIRELTNE